VSDVTQVLNAIEKGDAQAAGELLPLVYEELRRLAAHRMANEAPGNTLQPTALVHEAWLRLVGSAQQSWQNRAHFFGAAAEAMRRILIENARRKRALRHGGGQQRLPLQGRSSGADTGDPHAGETPKYMSLAEQYGLGSDMDVGDSGANEQTIEQEYQAYITVPLSPKNINILKFWEVHSYVNDISILLMGHRRLTGHPSPLFLRWRWTTCQSKQLLSLANGSFRQALKQIPSGGIASALS
jgi:DNA-directed RNA polymerase specialized sigma24 family protein